MVLRSENVLPSSLKGQPVLSGVKKEGGKEGRKERRKKGREGVRKRWEREGGEKRSQRGKQGERDKGKEGKRVGVGEEKRKKEKEKTTTRISFPTPRLRFVSFSHSLSHLVTSHINLAATGQWFNLPQPSPKF